ncbi:MAG: ribonuclease III [Alphaproteobacteria bacterium]|nr:ribonuclease III [Alphaproteobacteria bacterium]
MNAADLAALAARLDHVFRDPALLRLALTHPSAAEARATNGPSYERLEFLGDRVLALVMAEWLLERHPREREGLIARRHAELVRREALAQVAEALGLGAHLILSRAEEEQGGRDKPAMLADACEAVIGALYLDGGLEPARAFVRARWGVLVEGHGAAPKDAKTALQEWLQGRGLPLPTYEEVGRAGPEHAPVFRIAAVGGGARTEGEGPSKRVAEQAAAAALLARLSGQASTT